MNRTLCYMLLFLLSAASVPAFAQAEKDPASATMLDLLKPGQRVSITESPIGYKIEILTAEQIDKEIERRQKNRDKFGSGASARPKSEGIELTSKQSFDLDHPVVKTITFIREPGIDIASRRDKRGGDAAGLTLWAGRKRALKSYARARAEPGM